MALVAYDGSGSSSEDEDDQMSETPAVLNQIKNNASTEIAASATAQQRGVSKPNISKASFVFSKFTDDDDDEPIVNGGGNPSFDNEEDEAAPALSKFLPQPKKITETVKSEEEEIGPIPPKKTYGDEELPPPKPSSIPSLSSSKVQGKVRISIPFLNSLNDDESESDAADKRRFTEPSKKGSGLFAILPQPKNSFSIDSPTPNFVKSEKQASSKSSGSVSQNKAQGSSSMSRLIPDSVKNKLKRPSSSTIEEIRAKYSKKDLPASKRNAKDSDDSDDDGAGDFFSLDAPEAEVDLEALEKLKLPSFDPRPATTTSEAMEVEDEDGYQTQNAVPSSSSSQPDLMKFIQTKKGRKEDVQIIDINADDLRPDNTEWIKNITDESAVPARKSKGLGGMVKRKHQITYLAFEAKAREQELKNQWAQNRANKMATKNKYGF